MSLHLLKRLANQITHRIHTLPVLILMPHSRCNCRCVMCDIWRANHERKEISARDLESHLESIRSLGVRWVLLSGGEPLMHTNLWSFCSLLKREGIKITALSTGLLLEENADLLVRHCDEVIVSLDGSPEVHDRIRRLPGCAARLADGVSAIKNVRRSFPVTARTVVQRLNCADLPQTVEFAKTIGLDGISFLAADVSTTAFNRPLAWPAERMGEVALSASDLPMLATGIQTLIAEFRDDLAAGFIRETPERLWDIHRYYGALLGEVEFPPVACNAPWVSSVIEADGTVRPCFFHRSLGNIHKQNLLDVLNSPEAIRFRQQLNVARDPICAKCVCSLKVGWGHFPPTSNPKRAGSRRPRSFAIPGRRRHRRP